MQARDFLQQIVSVLDRIDHLEFIIQRLSAERINRFLVHSAREKVTDLLRLRCYPRIEMHILRFLSDVVERVVVTFNQLVKAAPTRVFGRNLGALYPTAVRIHEEVVLRFDGRVHVRWIDGRRALPGLRLLRSAQAE